MNSGRVSPIIYQKHHSFEDFFSTLGVSVAQETERCRRVVEAWLLHQHGAASSPAQGRKQAVLMKVLSDLSSASEQPTGSRATAPRFSMVQFIADETSRLADNELPRYLYHRYRYDVYPKAAIVDRYPPYIQIEPTSVCNFRCIFCYQSDPSFSGKKSGFQGGMSVELFRQVVDQIAGEVEFCSLASRGEPTACRDLPQMLQYAGERMIGVKLNTNASLLSEKLCHDILSSNVSTVVFSADAADKERYERFRVNGKFERVIDNIRMFQRIRREHYSSARTVSRVSGVFFDPEQQSFAEMVGFWEELVDQIAFVQYNPWESVYEAAPSGVEKPCSDLWRRLFVWYDGTLNPCDTDYKSTLQVGRFPEQSITGAWTGQAYQQLREAHQSGSRADREPCRRCVVT
jgi:radical SAM protein with 4Fe4S-binding SPASM domain